MGFSVVSGLGFGFFGAGFWVLGLGFLGLALRVLCFGLRFFAVWAWGLGFGLET